MLVHTRSGAASFAACLQLFRRYPLAISPGLSGSRRGSMVLMNRATGTPSFFVLTEASEDFFVLRSLNPFDGVNEIIRPGEFVSATTCQVLGNSMPVPRDGALLGWVTDRQVTAMLSVHCRLPEFWDDPVPVPEIRIMPLAGTSAMLHWPPFTASPLDGQLWQYVELKQVVDIRPLVTRSAGCAFWVPSPERRSVRHGEGFVVIRDNLRADEYWVPAGVFMDHWTLREGIQAPPPGNLLMLPGVVDLGRRMR